MRFIQLCTYICTILPIVIICFTIVTQGIVALSAAASSPEIYSLNSSPYGVKYGDWLAKWWQWYLSIPENSHPNSHFAPENCAIHQSGPVWFLPNVPSGGTANSPIVHKCVIPAGKSIAFVIETGECDRGMGEIKNDQEMVDCAYKGNDPRRMTLGATIDGVELKNLTQYRVTSSFFNINIPPNNIYGADAGTFRAVANGYLVIVKPLPPGTHKIVYQDTFFSPLTADRNYNHSKYEVMDLLIR